MYVAKPTERQLAWQDLELGVLIHYVLDIYHPELPQKERCDWHLEEIDPPKLDPEQWVRSAWEMGAKYAILVCNHGTGFSLWPTKVNDFSVASMKWKNGQGDILREFLDACDKYGLLPGVYYHPTCNGYYNIDNGKTYDYKGEFYQEYVRCVEAQVKELWTEYGELFEIWFDGGVLPPEDGGANLYPLLMKYQPGAITFQGPKECEHNLRWVGNEDGLAPENCWATTNAGEARFDGTVNSEEAGTGDPDGRYYWPAETDMPNRTHDAFGGGWGWQPGEEDKLYSTEQLLDCYIRSVGRNSNLLMGMAISTDGDFQDEAQFRAFGETIRETFGTPLAILEHPDITNGDITIPAADRAKYLVLRETIAEGQRIRAFTVLADGEEIYASNCVGHKRILPLEPLLGGRQPKEYTFRVTKSAGDWSLRDIALY